MMDVKKIILTAIAGMVMALSTWTGPARASDDADGSFKSGTIRQANLEDGQEKGVQGNGIPAVRDPDRTGPANDGSGYKHVYQNTWNHRYIKRNRYGSTAESPDVEQPGSAREQSNQVRKRSRLAGASQGRGFLDENGDGINDRAPDHDGDGVPNCQDPDWSGKKRDGTGYKHGNRLGQGDMLCERSQSRGRKKVQ